MDLPHLLLGSFTHPLPPERHMYIRPGKPWKPKFSGQVLNFNKLSF